MLGDIIHNLTAWVGIIFTKYYLVLILGAGSSATCSSILSKNIAADNDNPNLYHSIEDLKTDHLYDEIKQKGE